MSYCISAHGLLVHDQPDWPCAVCHPEATSDRQAWYLCVGCAQEMLAAAGAGMTGARALMDDVTDALAFFEVSTRTLASAAN
jgi:hypothetical protein